ncbi:hypothetical protein HYX13_00860 [Candidatus Woesearchaeota archaeon]|nr:hypothetical protein [Candidatus Woesearchaeota archaeon]
MVSFDTALRLLDTYKTFPETRTQQVELLQSIGYHYLRGGVHLSRCKDKQVRAVAYRVFKDADKVVLEEVHFLKSQIAREEYWNSLYDNFNIPEEQREDIFPADLEEMLLE